MNKEHLKTIVKDKYGQIAVNAVENDKLLSCCGTTCGCSGSEFSAFNDDYSELPGYYQEADLKLGCGIPTETASLRPGQTVLDLGSGAGNDAFVARALVGELGRVIGLDLTDAMIKKAQSNAKKLGFSNVEFRLGDIEQMPIDSESIDVVISNCVLNLVPDKKRAFAEMFRVLRRGGHFSVSDIVLARPLPPAIQKAAEMYAGCVSGAIEKKDYLEIIEKAGFINISTKLEKPITLPDQILAKYLSNDELLEFKSAGPVIVSVTVYGKKLF